MKVRKIRSMDLDTVLAIEQQCFDNCGWSRQDIEDTLDEGGTGFVAVVDGEIAGFQITNTEAFRNRGELVTIAVLPKFRRRGVGKRLLETSLASCGSRPLVVYVRERNLPAQLLFKSCGLEAKRTISGEYDSIDEDQYLMRSKAKVAIPMLAQTPSLATTEISAA